MLASMNLDITRVSVRLFLPSKHFLPQQTFSWQQPSISHGLSIKREMDTLLGEATFKTDFAPFCKKESTLKG